MLIYALNHATFFNENKLPNYEIRPANPNSQSSLLQLRTRDIWQRGCAPLDPCITMTTRKSKTVGIHLNDAEYAEIRARADAAAARSLGAYIKATAFDKPVSGIQSTFTLIYNRLTLTLNFIRSQHPSFF